MKILVRASVALIVATVTAASSRAGESETVHSPPILKLDDEKTAKPAKAEWSKADAYRVARITDRACSVKRIHEWVRVECGPRGYKDVELLSATAREGLDVAVTEGKDGSSAVVIFPAHRGDRRLFEIDRWTKWGGTPDVLVSEQWLAGDEGPIIVVDGVP